MKKLIRIGLLILLAYLFLRLSGAVSPDRDPGLSSLLVNRPWVAHLPKDERDLVPHLLLFEKSKFRGGAFGVASMWRVETNLVRFRYEPPKLDLEIPQRRVKGRLDVTISRCDEAPKPFNLCLELAEGARKLRLFSRNEWRVDGPRALGFDDSPFERHLAAWVERELSSNGDREELDPGPLEEAPEKLLFPGR